MTWETVGNLVQLSIAFLFVAFFTVVIALIVERTSKYKYENKKYLLIDKVMIFISIMSLCLFTVIILYLLWEFGVFNI